MTLIPDSASARVSEFFRGLDTAEGIFGVKFTPEQRKDGTTTGGWSTLYRDSHIVLFHVEHHPIMQIGVWQGRDVFNNRPGRLVYSNTDGYDIAARLEQTKAFCDGRF